jgi:hypothetical protein
MEIATPGQMPTEHCNVHEPHALLARDDNSESEFPRAELAVDLNELRPVGLKGPVVVAEKDPYNSATAQLGKIEPDVNSEVKSDQPDNGPAKSERPERPNESSPAAPVIGRTEDGKPVKKAIPVSPEPAQPVQSETPVEIRKAIPVGPLERETDESLLKSATPPPPDSDE